MWHVWVVYMYVMCVCGVLCGVLYVCVCVCGVLCGAVCVLVCMCIPAAAYKQYAEA